MGNKIGPTKPGMARALVIIGLALISLSLVFTTSCRSSKPATTTPPVTTPPVTTPPVTTTPAQAAAEVMITDSGGGASSFFPAAITVPVGTTVTWVNSDSSDTHTVTSDSGLFDSGGLTEMGEAALAIPATFSYTFTEPGTFSYHCTPHPDVTGTVIVE